MARITLTIQTLLDMSIQDFEEYAKTINRDKLWALFFDAQKQQDAFINSMTKKYQVEINEDRPVKT